MMQSPYFILLLTTSLATNALITHTEAFTTSTRTRTNRASSSFSSSSLQAVADPPMMPAEHQDDKRKKKKDNYNGDATSNNDQNHTTDVDIQNQNNNIGQEAEERWRPIHGGFLLPKIFQLRKRSKDATATNTDDGTDEEKDVYNLSVTPSFPSSSKLSSKTSKGTHFSTTSPLSPSSSSTNKINENDVKKKSTNKNKQKVFQHPNILTIDNIIDYKEHVALENEAIVVVRFFASWCKSCKASEPYFKRLVNKYSSSERANLGRAEERGEMTMKRRRVKFVQVPLNKKTAYLQEGLGVRSVPFAHIYHPEAGLVEEQKFSKRDYAMFGKVLESYVLGSCDVPILEEKEDASDEGIGQKNVFAVERTGKDDESVIGAFE